MQLHTIIIASTQRRGNQDLLPCVPLAVSTERHPFRGSPAAPVTLIEFSDYQCPLSLVDLELHAKTIGLETGAFWQCLDSEMTAHEIRDDMAEGQKAGVRGTPTFFIGRADPSSSSVKVLRMLRGAQAYANFKQALDSLLAAPKSSPDP